MTFSVCEFDAQVGKVYAPPAGPYPGYGNGVGPAFPDWSKEQGIILQSTGANPKPIPGCTTFNGHDAPGGFGYLEGEGCSAIITDDDWVKGQTGNKAKGCDLDATIGTVISIPVFDCEVAGSSPKPSGAPTGTCDIYDQDTKGKDKAGGQSNWYHIAGWAKFYVSGVGTGGKPESSLLTGKTCKNYTSANGNSDRCLIGWFVSGVLADAPLVGPVGGGDDFGTYAVVPAG